MSLLDRFGNWVVRIDLSRFFSVPSAPTVSRGTETPELAAMNADLQRSLKEPGP